MASKIDDLINGFMKWVAGKDKIKPDFIGGFFDYLVTPTETVVKKQVPEIGVETKYRHANGKYKTWKAWLMGPDDPSSPYYEGVKPEPRKWSEWYEQQNKAYLTAVSKRGAIKTDPTLVYLVFEVVEDWVVAHPECIKEK